MMTMVYIGNLDDPNFNYYGGKEVYNGNIPKRRGEPFPDGKDNVFRFVSNQIRSEIIPGRQVDWGASVAPLYPMEIYEVFKEFYEPKELGMLERRLKNLEQDKKYALVACEL